MGLLDEQVLRRLTEIERKVCSPSQSNAVKTCSQLLQIVQLDEEKIKRRGRASLIGRNGDSVILTGAALD